jgi:ABC-type glycerol-3-phosphate transport system permease component
MIRKWLDQRFHLVAFTPTALFVCLFGLVPFLYTIYLSTLSYSLIIPEKSGQFVGFENYLEAFGADTIFRSSVFVSIGFAFICVASEVIIGTCLALLIGRRLAHNRWILPAILLPVIMSPLTIGLLWKLVLQSEFGVWTYLLRSLGILAQTSILGSNLAFVAVILIDIWQWTPFVFALISAALIVQPRRPIEAASLDGASRWQILRDVTLPYLSPFLAAVTLIRLVDALREFEKIHLLTGGGPGLRTELINIYLWRTNFKEWNLGYGAALSVVVYLLAVFLAFLFFRLFRLWYDQSMSRVIRFFRKLRSSLIVGTYKKIVGQLSHFARLIGRHLVQYAQFIPDRRSRASQPKLRPNQHVLTSRLIAKWPWLERIMKRLVLLGVYIACFIYLSPIFWLLLTAFKSRIDAVAIPPRLFFKPTVQHFHTVFIEKGFLFAIWNSLIVATVSTLFSMLLGTTAAYGIDKFRPKTRDTLLFSFLCTRMVPPVVMVLPIYVIFQTLGWLDTRRAVILMHILGNLGFAVWVISSYLRDLPPRVEEIALLDGHSRAGAFFKIMIPLASPGLFVTGIFCFLFSWNEYLFASILSAFESKTIPVGIPGLISHHGTYWEQVAAIGVVSMIPAFLIPLLGGKHLTRALSLGFVSGRR